MWKGNRCPGSDECHSFESGYCLNKCDHQCVPASVLVHIANKAATDKHIGTYVSATALLGCLRELYLERTKDWFQEPPTSWFSVRGTLLHTVLTNPDFHGLIKDMSNYITRIVDAGMTKGEIRPSEAGHIDKLWMTAETGLIELAKFLPKPYKVGDWESEIEFELPLGVIDGQERFLRGTIDVLRAMLGEIIDYKTVGDRSLPYIGKYGCKPEHIQQFNIYRLLVERGYPVDEKRRATWTPIKINKITAYYLTMMAVVGTGTNMVEVTPWTATEPKTYSTEVARQVVNERDDVVLKRGKRKGSNNPEDYQISHKTKYHLTYRIPHVPLLDLDEVYKFVIEKATILFRAFDHGEIPPLPSIEMQLWKCDSYCPVRIFCDEICKERSEERAKREEESNEVPVEG
jgi:hypothetical protein